ncbi:hypothetical protein AS593_07580 [Caulobacter vibrioides]|nr:hypothetical protein AS593_07580 [Caulobacter vibrioides]
MDPISNAERLALILRQRLLERARRQASSSATERTPQRPAASQTAPLEGLALPERRRALISAVLLEQFGAEFANEARFHQVVARVCEALESDPQTVRLVDAALSETLKSD